MGWKCMEHQLNGNCCLMRSGFSDNDDRHGIGEPWQADGSILDGVMASFKFRNWGGIIKF